MPARAVRRHLCELDSGAGGGRPRPGQRAGRKDEPRMTRMGADKERERSRRRKNPVRPGPILILLIREIRVIRGLKLPQPWHIRGNVGTTLRSPSALSAFRGFPFAPLVAPSWLFSSASWLLGVHILVAQASRPKAQDALRTGVPARVPAIARSITSAAPRTPPLRWIASWSLLAFSA